LRTKALKILTRKKKQKHVTHRLIDVEPKPPTTDVDHGGDVNTFGEH